MFSYRLTMLSITFIATTLTLIASEPIEPIVASTAQMLSQGKVDVAKLLIESIFKKYIDQRLDDKNTILHLLTAYPEDLFELVKLAVTPRRGIYCDADVTLQNKYGKTALHNAACKGRLEQVKLLLEKDASIIDIKDIYGFTALMYAAQNNHTQVVSYLLDCRANPHVIQELIQKSGKSITTNAAIYTLLAQARKGILPNSLTQNPLPPQVPPTLQELEAILERAEYIEELVEKSKTLYASPAFKKISPKRSNNRKFFVVSSVLVAGGIAYWYRGNTKPADEADLHKAQNTTSAAQIDKK